MISSNHSELEYLLLQICIDLLLLFLVLAHIKMINLATYTLGFFIFLPLFFPFSIIILKLIIKFLLLLCEQTHMLLCFRCLLLQSIIRKLVI